MFFETRMIKNTNAAFFLGRAPLIFCRIDVAIPLDTFNATQSSSPRARTPSFYSLGRILARLRKGGLDSQHCIHIGAHVESPVSTSVNISTRACMRAWVRACVRCSV